jgi:predicted ATP-grasp superfamily ATP-dependent carboligase
MMIDPISTLTPCEAGLDTSTPVLVLGGKENSLSLARHLGRLGIEVRVSGPANCWGMYSRNCTKALRIPFGVKAVDHWRDLLLPEGASGFEGHVILPCSDDALEFVAEHDEALRQRYLYDHNAPHMRLALLDKLKTMEMARAAGLDTPDYWPVSNESEVRELRAKITFPVMVKPLLSHRFSRVFGRKLFIVENDFEDLVEKVKLARAHELEVMVIEMIPGPDSLLTSYYTYVDDEGANLFHFTKRVLRRYPTNRGGACYHITEWLPDTADLGRRFFAEIEFRGLGNIEFKRDIRDGKLKVIEANARFTAAQELAVRAGTPIDLVVYCDLTGQAVPRFPRYREFLRYWYPLRDFLAFLELRKRGELTTLGWIKSVLPYRWVSPLHSFSDIVPSLSAARAVVAKMIWGHG